MTQGLIADIGATNARFALVDEAGKITQEVILKCGSYPSFEQALQAYLKQRGLEACPKLVALAIAAPIKGDEVKMTNHQWSFSQRSVKEKFALDQLYVVNDFEAVALAVPGLTERHLHKVGGAEPIAERNIAVLGPGSGLGTAFLIWQEEGCISVSGEGQHATMAARTEREFQIFQHMQSHKYSHVSAERVCSGKGLMNLYDTVRALDNKMDKPALTPEEISQKAQFGNCEICQEVVHLMFRFLGRVASNMALTVNAYGGVYLAGGILPQMLPAFEASEFRFEFESKGNFRDYMKAIPAYVITHDYPAFEGLRRLVVTD